MASQEKIHLVTGAQPTDHVSSANQGNMYAGMLGTGSYVLNVGDNLEATMKNANTIEINTGTAVHNGRQFDVEAPKSLTVDSGTQGQKRNDLVVIRYSKTEDEENGYLVVLKGTPTTGTPADPSYNTGSIIDGVTTSDMPLYRIELNGVSVGDPVPLFDVMISEDEFRDSVSQEVQTSGNWTYRVYKNGIAECWLSESFRSNQWYRANGGYMLREGSSYSLNTSKRYPVDFVEEPCVHTQLMSTTTQGFACMLLNTSTDLKLYSPRISAWRPEQQSHTQTGRLNIHVIGSIAQ